MALTIAPGGASCFTVEHESQQSLNLCFAGHLLEKHLREPDGFFGEAAAPMVGASHVVPSNAEGGVNGLKHGIQPRCQLLAFRHFEPDAAGADLGLGSDQPLSHGLG